MSSIPFRPFFARRARLTPAYTLSAVQDLSPDQREALSGLTEHPSYTTLLLPTPISGLPVKAVDRDVAALLRALPRPAVLQDVLSATGETMPVVAALILDGTLELETANGFRSGPATVPFLVHDAAPAPAQGPIAHLSLAALHYAQWLPLPAPLLAGRLYAYHRLPLPPPRHRRPAQAHDTTQMLGLAPGQPLHARIEAAFDVVPHDYWHIWLRRDHAMDPDAPIYKLYVSPHPDDLPDVLARCVPLLADAGVRSFKVGRDPSGLLRPDKFILYFAHGEALTSMTDRLRPVLRGTRAHGVPFTAGLTDDGMLSWGLDPPGTEQVLDSDARQSWRSWITRRLAEALVRAQACPDLPVAPWQYAMLRVALDGVDTNTWTPHSSLWLTQDPDRHADLAPAP